MVLRGGVIMTISERIRILRKEKLKITQEEFGEPLGLSRANIANIEAGRISVTDRVLTSICREFNVNILWLTDGKGDIFTTTPESVVDELAEDYHLDDIDKKIIENYLQLDDNQRKVLKDYFKKIFT